MALTVLEVIENAYYNLKHHGMLGAKIALSQLETVLKEVENGKELHDEIDEED